MVCVSGRKPLTRAVCVVKRCFKIHSFQGERWKRRKDRRMERRTLNPAAPTSWTPNGMRSGEEGRRSTSGGGGKASGVENTAGRRAS